MSISFIGDALATPGGNSSDITKTSSARKDAEGGSSAGPSAKMSRPDVEISDVARSLSKMQTSNVVEAGISSYQEKTLRSSSLNSLTEAISKPEVIAHKMLQLEKQLFGRS